MLDFQNTIAVKPCGVRGPATVDEAFSWLKWYEEQSALLAHSGMVADSVYHLHHMAELIPLYRICFPEHRLEFSLVAARVKRLSNCNWSEPAKA